MSHSPSFSLFLFSKFFFFFFLLSFWLLARSPAHHLLSSIAGVVFEILSESEQQPLPPPPPPSSSGLFPVRSQTKSKKRCLESLVDRFLPSQWPASFSTGVLSSKESPDLTWKPPSTRLVWDEVEWRQKRKEI